MVSGGGGGGVGGRTLDLFLFAEKLNISHLGPMDMRLGFGLRSKGEGLLP